MKIDQPEGLDEDDIVAEPTVSEAGQPATGTVDDDDDPDDEREYENEAPVRERSDATEAPEEFEVDDEDEA
jgi:hypothetical protein